MVKTQPSYTKEFKQEAVKLVETSNKTKSEIARDLGISDSADTANGAKNLETMEIVLFQGRAIKVHLKKK